MENEETNARPIPSSRDDRAIRPLFHNLIIINPDFWNRRPVFVTGHTGFMGGWPVYDRRAIHFLACLHLASAMIWMR
jgi:hypothetical protein